MGVLVRTLFTLLAAVSAATAIAQPVVWERTPTVLQNTLPPEQVASDGAGGVYVARLGGFGSVTRIDASGVELWTARILFVPYCVQCRLDLHGLTANAEAAFVIVRAHFIKFGPCGVFCAISFVTRFSAADGSLSSPFGLSVQQQSSGIADIFVTPTGDLLATGYRGAAGVLARAGNEPFTVEAGSAFEQVVADSNGGVVATLRSGTAISLRRYLGLGAMQWDVPLDSVGCLALVAGVNGGVACVSGNVRVFNADGSLAWQTPSGIGAAAAAFDAGGNLWLAGAACSLVNGGQMCSPTVWKFGPAGTLIASDTVPARYGISSWHTLSIAPGGDIYVASSGEVARYDANGARRWRAGYGVPLDSLRSSIVATSDGVIVGGTARDGSGRYVVVKLGATALPTPAIELAASAPVAGQPILLTVTALGTPPPIGNVLVTGAGAELCFVTLAAAASNRSQASCRIVLPAGAHTLTATYTGGDAFGEAIGSVSLLVAPDQAAAEIPALGLPALIALVVLVAAAGLRRVR